MFHPSNTGRGRQKRPEINRPSTAYLKVRNIQHWKDDDISINGFEVDRSSADSLGPFPHIVENPPKKLELALPAEDPLNHAKRSEHLKKITQSRSIRHQHWLSIATGRNENGDKSIVNKTLTTERHTKSKSTTTKSNSQPARVINVNRQFDRTLALTNNSIVFIGDQQNRGQHASYFLQATKVKNMSDSSSQIVNSYSPPKKIKVLTEISDFKPPSTARPFYATKSMLVFKRLAPNISATGTKAPIVSHSSEGRTHFRVVQTERSVFDSMLAKGNQALSAKILPIHSFRMFLKRTVKL
jgi:hypothetical protein